MQQLPIQQVARLQDSKMTAGIDATMSCMSATFTIGRVKTEYSASEKSRYAGLVTRCRCPAITTSIEAVQLVGDLSKVLRRLKNHIPTQLVTVKCKECRIVRRLVTRVEMFLSWYPVNVSPQYPCSSLPTQMMRKGTGAPTMMTQQKESSDTVW